MSLSTLCLIALTACGTADDRSGKGSATDVGVAKTADLRQSKATAVTSSGTVKAIPEDYLRAFTCVFDENPLVAMERYHKTPAGRATRAHDLEVLKPLGFQGGGYDGDLESLGGKITAPPNMMIFGLPVRFVELNGMIGDANAMYVTAFAKGVAVDQVVRAAKLELDQERYRRYKLHYYSRRISNDPYTELFLDDEGDGKVLLVCQVQSTPD